VSDEYLCGLCEWRQIDHTCRHHCGREPGWWRRGKTTTALGLSGAFADRGDDTLLIDLDPQRCATERTGFKNRDGENGDLYHQKVLSLQQVLTDPARTEDIVQLIEHHDEFDLIPANMAMKGLKRQVADRRERGDAVETCIAGTGGRVRRDCD